MTTIDHVGLALLHFFWQGTLLGLVAWLMFHVTRRAQARYLIAISLLGCMPLAVILTLATAGPTAGVGPRGVKPISTTTTSAMSAGAIIHQTPPPGEAALTPDIASNRGGGSLSEATTAPGRALRTFLVPLVPHLRLIVVIWIAGVLALSVRLLGGWTIARRLLREKATRANEWQPVIDRLRERLGIRRAVRGLESALAQAPSVVGWLRPVILLPVSALAGLTPRQVEILIAHELAHVRRHDYLVNLLQSMLEALLFYHPVVWWLSRRVREERELCCDDLAIKATGDPREYAETLYALELLRAPVPALAMAATGGSLLHRIRRLVEPRNRRDEPFPRWIAGALLILMIAVTSAILPLSRLMVPPPLAGERHDRAGGAPTSSPKVDPKSLLTPPDSSIPLSERVAWARGEADRRGQRSYWVVYTIQPLEWARGAMYIGEGVNILLDQGQSLFVGGVVSTSDPGEFRIAGTPLLPLLGGRSGDAAVLLKMRGGPGRPVPEQVIVESLSLAHEFEGRPIYWLGPAGDSESLELTRTLYAGARGAEKRAEYVRLIGVHRTSDVIVPELLAILRGRDDAPVRTEAVEWLARHPRMESLRALDDAARHDRSPDVQREAAEAVGDVNLPEAFEVLRRLSLELDSRDARREAVEALGHRPEAGAEQALTDIARGNDDSDIRREAVESLGDLTDGRGFGSLTELLERGDSEDVRAEAAETIGETFPPERGIPLLGKSAQFDPAETVRREALEGLVLAKDGAGIESARRLASESPDAGLRRAAVEEIAPHLPRGEAVRWLVSVIENDASPDVQREAVETLGELKDDRAVPVLIDLAEHHPDVDIRRMASQALEDRR